MARPNEDAEAKVRRVAEVVPGIQGGPPYTPEDIADVLG